MEDKETAEPGGVAGKEAPSGQKKRKLAAFLAERNRHWTEECHGASVLRLFCGRPRRATGCLLPDGTAVSARCVARSDAAAGAAPSEVGGVWLRELPSDGAAPLARRGRLLVELGVALRFVDEPRAGEEADPASPPPSLERDLARSAEVATRIVSDVFAALLYAALCNTAWRHRASGTLWSCSWRGVGGIVAHLRAEGDYLDWYGSGGEGIVDEEVLAVIEGLGWEIVPEENGG